MSATVQNRGYKAASWSCPMSRCGWIASTGAPKGRQEWADTHLMLLAELAVHLRREHNADDGTVDCGTIGYSLAAVSS